MSSLKSVLLNIDQQKLAMGAALSDRARAALEAYRGRAALASSAVLVVVFAAVLIVLVTSAYYLRDPNNLKLAVGGLGVSMGGALVVLRGTWKDWSQANLLLVLIDDAREDQIAHLIDTLIAKL